MRAGLGGVSMWALMSELAVPATLLVITALFGWIVGRHMPAPMHPFQGVVSRAREHNHVGVQTVAVQPQLVKAALHGLFIAETAHWDLPPNLVVLSRSAKSREDLRTLLVDVVADVAMSRDPRAAEAGRLLLDYYVKRVGSHEVVMERLHLSRPTFYRRLHRGLVLTAARLDELNGTSPARGKPSLQWVQLVRMRAAETEIESSARLSPRPKPSDTAPQMHDVRAEAEKNLRRLPMGLRPRLKLLAGSGR